MSEGLLQYHCSSPFFHCHSPGQPLIECREKRGDVRLYDEAFAACTAVLSREMRTALLASVGEKTLRWEEIRLRAGRGVTVQSDGVEKPVLLAGVPITVTSQDLNTVLERATQSSYQSAAEQLRRGFYTMRGGHRIGVSGSMSVREGHSVAFRELSSLNIRVARAFPGIADPLGDKLLEGKTFPSTLILSPPGAGKTTLLRELLRVLSDRFSLRCALADERGEVAALWRGVPQLEVGRYTDVLDGCPKAEGMLLLLRSMNPQILAADEITAPEDVRAVTMAANCGVSVLATAHGGSVEELSRRPLYRELLAQNIFRRVILIGRDESGERNYQMEGLPC